MRRLACDRVTDILTDILEGCPDSAVKLLEIQDQLVKAIDSKSEEAKELVKQRVNEMLGSGVDAAFDAGEMALADVGDRADRAADGLAQAAGAAGVEGADGAELMAMPEIDRDQAKKDMEEVLQAFGGFVKGFALSQMDLVTQMVTQLTVQLLDAIHDAYTTAKAKSDVKSGEGQAALREAMYKEVEGTYAKVHQKVFGKVGGIVAFLDKAMAPAADAGGDDE